MADIATKRQQLHAILNNYFNTEELNELAFLMGLDFDNIAGATKSAKVTNFISNCERTSRVSQLIFKAKEARPLLPDADWPTPWRLEPKRPDTPEKEAILTIEPPTRKDDISPFGWWKTILIGGVVPMVVVLIDLSDGSPRIANAFFFVGGGLIGGAVASWIAKKVRLGLVLTIIASVTLGYFGALVFTTLWEISPLSF